MPFSQESAVGFRDDAVDKTSGWSVDRDSRGRLDQAGTKSPTHGINLSSSSWEARVAAITPCNVLLAAPKPHPELSMFTHGAPVELLVESYSSKDVVRNIPRYWIESFKSPAVVEDGPIIHS